MSSDARLIQSLEETAHFISNKYKLDDVLNNLTTNKTKRRNSISNKQSLSSDSTTTTLSEALTKMRQLNLMNRDEEQEDDGACSVHSARSRSGSLMNSLKLQQQQQLQNHTINTTTTNNNNNNALLLSTSSTSSTNSVSIMNNNNNFIRPGSSASSNSHLSRRSSLGGSANVTTTATSTSQQQLDYPPSNSKLSSPTISKPNLSFSLLPLHEQPIIIVSDELTPSQPPIDNTTSATTIQEENGTIEQSINKEIEAVMVTTEVGMENDMRLLQEIHDPRSSLNSSRSSSSLGMNNAIAKSSSSVNSSLNNSFTSKPINGNDISINGITRNFQRGEMIFDLIEPPNNDDENLVDEQQFDNEQQQEEIEQNYDELDETYEIHQSTSSRTRTNQNHFLTSSESIINEVFFDSTNKQTIETIEQVISQLSQVENELEYDDLQVSTNNDQDNYGSRMNSFILPELNDNYDLKYKLTYYANFFKEQSSSQQHNNEKIKLECLKKLSELVLLSTTTTTGQSSLSHPLANEFNLIINLLINNLKQFKKSSATTSTTTTLNRSILSLLIQLIKYLKNDHIHSLLELLQHSKYFEIYDLILTLAFRLGISTLELIFESILTTNLESEWNNIILTHLVNHPLLIQHLIIPTLHRECLSFEHDKRVCAVRALKHYGSNAATIEQCLPTLLSMMQQTPNHHHQHSSLDFKILLAQTIRAMGDEGEKALIKLLMEPNSSLSSPTCKEAIATVFGELPYCLQSQLTVIANSDIHCYVKSSTNPRILYYYSGGGAGGAGGSAGSGNDDRSKMIPPLLLFDSRELLQLSRNIIRQGLLDEIDYYGNSNNQYSCKPDLTLLHAMVCSLKTSIMLNSSSNGNNNQSVMNSSRINQHSSFNNISYSNNNNNSTLMLQQQQHDQNNNSTILLKGYYLRECNRQQQQKNLNSSSLSNSTTPTSTPRSCSSHGNTNSNNCCNYSTLYGGKPNKDDLNHSYYFDKLEISNVSMEVVNSLLCNFRYMEESVRIASVKSITNILLVQQQKKSISSSSVLPEVMFSQVIESLKLECLTDPSPRVRALALNAFAVIGTSQQVQSMKKREKRSILQCILPMIRDSHWQVRMSACNALCEHSEHLVSMSQFDRDFYRQVFQVLICALREGSLCRNEICKCLGLLHYDGISQLIYLIRQDSQSMSIQVRIAACHGLGLISMDSPYMDRIVETLFMTANSIEKTPPLVRRAAIKSLGDLAGKSSNKLSYLSPRSLLPFLYSFLKDRQLVVRQMSAQVLAHSGGPHGELLLMEALLKDSNSIIRSSAAYGMTFIGPKSIISLILALSNENVGMVRKSICASIESFKLDEIMEVIEQKAQKESILNTIHSILSNSFTSDGSTTNGYVMRQRRQHSRELLLLLTDNVLDLFNYIINHYQQQQ